MILHSIRVENFCKFRQPFTLSGLEAGLNLVTGPNESGKSTLVHAIRSVFLERYNTTSLSDLQPYGNSAVSPSVQVKFTYLDHNWALTKAFVKTKRCDLMVGGDHLSNEDAEQRLSELLRFTYAGRGASKPEHQGVPGLLWVEQGSGQQLDNAAKNAGTHLQNALSSLVGNINHTEGDAVLEQVNTQLKVLQTPTGKPTGELKACQGTVDELQQAIAELEVKIDLHRQDVDRLGQLRAELNRQLTEESWKQTEQQLADAREQLQAAEKLEEQLKNYQLQQVLLEEAITSLKQQQELYQKQKTQLQKREQEWINAQAQLASAEHQLEQAQQQEQQSQQQCDAAEVVQKQAQQWQHLQSVLAQGAALQQEQQRLAADLHKAQQASQALQELQRQEAANPHPAISEAQLKSLQDLQKKCEISQARLDAVATQLHYQLAPHKQAHLDGEVIQGEGSISISGQAQLVIEGVGQFSVIAGGNSIASQQREHDQLLQRYQQQLSQLQVSDLDHARQRHKQQEQYEKACIEQQQLLERYAPHGLEVLQQQADLADQHFLEKQQEQERLQQLLGDAPDDESIADADEQLQLSLTALKNAEDLKQQAAMKQAEWRAKAESAQSEYQRLQQELNDPQRQQQRQLWQQQEQDKLASLALVNKEEQAHRDQLQHINPELLRQDCERYQRSITNQKDNLQQLRKASIELEAKLRAEGANAMEEQLEQRYQELEYQQQRLQQLERHAAALALLKQQLQEKRDDLTRQLQAPLQKHLNHYLNLLFPGATVEVDEQLIPTGFHRNGEQGSLSDLSFGTREQMGLIARLAYADLLQEAGQPTLIILDDSLVHSDRGRLEQMQRILFDAQQRHQILLLSCHPHNWQNLGCKTFDIEQLSTTTADVSVE